MTTSLAEVVTNFIYGSFILQKIEKKESIITYKLLYTIIILLVYLIGKSLPLYGINLDAYLHKTMDAEGLLLQTISGDIYRCSIFALGISPYMISSMLIQVVHAIQGSESRAKKSPKKTNQQVLGMTLFFAVIQSVLEVRKLQFAVAPEELFMARTIASTEMIAGVMIIIWLSTRNKQYGIGGQTAIIFTNILDGIRATISQATWDAIKIPLLISIVVMVIMLIMENAELRIPLQRISIHNIYADKNYLAIKLNPIGVMPAMFSTAFFMVPQLLVSLLNWIFPTNETILWWKEHMVLTEPLGVAVYIGVLYCLTIGFSRVFINPQELTEQFLKSGDSLENIRAGKDTKRYLSKAITRVSLVSAGVMSICLGVPLILQMHGRMENTLAALPSSVMMLTGIWCNLYREIVAIKELDEYKPFI